MQSTSTQSGFSPDIEMRLLLDGELFNVASAGPMGVVIRDVKVRPAGVGVIELVVDGQQTSFDVELWDGLNPDRPLQPFRILKTVEVHPLSA